MTKTSYKDRLTACLSELTIRQSGRNPVQNVIHRFINFFVRLNRFYNKLYEKSKPRWMKK